MEDISDRITRLTQELRALHSQLQWPSFYSANSDDQDRILNQLLNAGLGHELKHAVDLLSQFLWCYIESAAALTDAEDIDYARQSVRLGQATDMLRLLHHSSCPMMESLALIQHATMTVTRHAETRTSQRAVAMKTA
jgi:hypothetical protein